MSLAAGTRLSHYEVLEPIGKGGMGEVYRARDTKLDREVAIKVLPEEFANDEERLARFEREAKLLASLNHPNIASIYGLEESDGVKALVLELVEGPTLAERIAKGPIPVEETLAIARQIAEALEAGHEAGVIHRDLKPANVKVKEDGGVKVLDYGLAKALEGDTPSGTASELSQSPTLTRHGTQIGVILGTAAYMSPEQARGKRVDKRTDIWAFGAVLYEMFTARRAFPGDGVSDVLASVIKSEPDWHALPSEAPRKLLERCLRKDPKSRLRDIGDARVELVEEPTHPADVPVSSRRTLAAWLIATAAVGALLGWLGASSSSTGNDTVIRATLELPAGHTLETFSAVAISPDGTRVVFVAVDDEGSSILMRRKLDEFESEPIPGTEGALAPFFSPDGEQVGFSLLRRGDWADLMKIDLAGGVAGSICDDCAWMSAASWGSDDAIVFVGTHSGLARISANGGEIETLTEPEPLEDFHGWPHWITGGRDVLFTIRTSEGSKLALYSVASGEVQTLDMTHGASQALYAASGHIIYGQGRRLLALPFDLERRRALGAAVSIADGLQEDEMYGLGIVSFDVSRTGTLVYALGESDLGRSTMVWVDRGGIATPITTELGDYRWPTLSPDGTRIAYSDRENISRPNVWILDLERGTKTRFTTVESANIYPNWSPDGTKILFSSTRLGSMDLFWKPTERTGDAVPVLGDRAERYSGSWAPDNETIMFQTAYVLSSNLWIAMRDGTAEPFLDSSFSEQRPRFSPDGKWITYLSNASGQYEVYITSYPEADRSILVSSEGALYAEWSADGSELFHLTDEALMVVDVSFEPALRVGKPRKLFDWPNRFFGLADIAFDVSPDGQRFVMIRAEGTASETKLRLVHNWFRDLERLVPTDD